jgi:hypothetical protein
MAVLRRTDGLHENHSYLLSFILFGFIIYILMYSENEILSHKIIYFAAHFIAVWTLPPGAAAQLAPSSYGHGVQPHLGLTSKYYCACESRLKS